MNGDLDDREMLAAEYVLGTLAPADRARAEAERDRDPAFARLIDDWSAKLSPVAEAVGDVAPPPNAWTSIETALAGRLRSDAAGDTQPISVRPPLLQRLSFWRWSTAGALAVAACLALYIGGVQRLEPEPETRYVAVLNAGDARPAWVLTVDTRGRTLTIRPVADVAAPDKALELWMIRDADTPPRSLGLLDPTQPLALPIQAAVDDGRLQVAAFAVSLEPAGGSPTGLPTGPVLYQGDVYPIEE